MTIMTKDRLKRARCLPPLDKVPEHVAIIMDGNGRWARQRGLPRSAGHRQGTENLRRIIRAAAEFGVRIMTIYAFSTENWSRPRREVMLLMRILEMVIDRELQELDEEGVQIRHIGELDGIPERLARKVVEACEYTRHNQRLILNVAFNYGGRDEIVRMRCSRSFARRHRAGSDHGSHDQRVYVYQRSARSRPDHSHQWRVSPEQFSDLAGRLQRNLYDGNVLARFRPQRVL